MPSAFPNRADQSAALAFLVFLVLFSWVLLTAADPDGPKSVSSYIAIGYVLGTIFGQTTLAAAWMALGPFTLLWRGLLSVGWATGTLLAFAAGIGRNSGPDDVLVTVGLCLVGQWIVVQVPLWALALLWGLRIGHRDEAPLSSRLQFGIRQLMLVTTIVAIVFGAGRMVVGNLAARFETQSLRGGESLVFIFLAVAGIVLTLPLVLATLVPRFALLATLAVTLLIGLATAWELPLMQAIGPLSGPDEWHLVWINGFSVAWVLVVMGLLRLAGYGLVAGR